MYQEDLFLRAVQSFEPVIKVPAAGLSSDFIYDALKKNVKLTYYIESLSASVVYGRETVYEIRITYTNTHVPLSDIHTVNSEQQVYSLFAEYLGRFKDRVVIFPTSAVNVQKVYGKFMDSHAAFYSNLISVGLRTASSSLAPIGSYEFSFDYRLGRVKLAMMENETTAEVKRLAQLLFLPSMSAQAKVLLAHNYLAYNVQYTLIKNANDVEAGYMQSAYGALIRKKCVCQGYAEAFKRLMDYAGIPCDVVCGKTAGSDVHHAWNMVKLNGERDNYHVDVTWDSTGASVRYDYFGLSDAAIGKDHSWSREFTPKCNSLKNLLTEAKRDLERFKAQLLAKGVDRHIL